MADRAFPRTAYHKGSEVGQVFVNGEEAEFVFGKGTQLLPHLGAEIWGRTEVRMALDDTGDWFEVGFRIDSNQLQGNSAAGFTDPGGYFKIELQQSLDLVNWNMGKFVPCAVPVADNGDGSWTYWSRCTLPRLWKYVTIDETATTNRYGKSITAIHLFGSLLALPNYPYAMPAAAAQLQTDLIALGYAGSIVSSVAAPLSVEVKRHWLPSTSAGYTVDTYQTTLSGTNVTQVRTHTGAAITLPSYPYAMPASAAQLQTDLRNAGHSGAVVRLFGDSWTVFIPNRATILAERRFQITFTPGDPHPQWDMFGASIADNPDDKVDGQFSNVRATTGLAPLTEAAKQFARLKITPGTRYQAYY